jgi:ribonucleotide monophosphatase NagD (HAD superfamily)
VDYAFNYYKLWYATSCIYVNNAVYFATNEDPNIKLGYYKVPGAGTMSASIAKSSETTPINTGKPNPISINLVCERDNLDKSQCLMIGDSLYTDMQFANNAGIDGLLVLTGVTNQEEYEKYSKDPGMGVPTYYADDLRVFI